MTPDPVNTVESLDLGVPKLQKVTESCSKIEFGPPIFHSKSDFGPGPPQAAPWGAQGGPGDSTSVIFELQKGPCGKADPWHRACRKKQKSR
jgi:hypothetical protein